MGIAEETEDDEETTFGVEVDDRGRITIPVTLRDRLGIRPGDELTVALDAGRLDVRPQQSDLVTATSGKSDWGGEAFPDSGEAAFGGRPRRDE